MACSCKRLIDLSVESARRRARQAESLYASRLDAFRTGIQEGIRQSLARHLYKAGVYLASLEGGLSPNPSTDSVLGSLARRLPASSHVLHVFLQENRGLVEGQAASINHQDLLRRILRRRDQAPGLLEANAMRELQQAETVVSLAERMERYLTAWRESMRMEAKVHVYPITDMHG